MMTIVVVSCFADNSENYHLTTALRIQTENITLYIPEKDH